MSSHKPRIDQGFIMCAGMATRMRPLTENIPKPMVEIAGKPLVDYLLDEFEMHGMKKVVLNTHYKAEVLEDHLDRRTKPEIKISHEEVLLNTGGGLKNALANFNDSDFFVVNGDAFFEPMYEKSALKHLEEEWNPEIMDILILLEPVSRMHLTKGIGDYDLDQDSRAVRSIDQSGKFMFTSLRINTPKIFETAPDGAFSYLDLLDEAERKGRLFGLVHDGNWHHISTPDDVSAVNAHLLEGRKIA